jgi:hypothetical protein
VIECGPSRFLSLAAEPLSAARQSHTFAPSLPGRLKTRVRGFSGCPSGRLSHRGRLRPISTPGFGPCAYKTASGRPKWPNRDPLGEKGGINLYRFVRNEPISNIDPNGHIPIAIPIGVGLRACLANPACAAALRNAAMRIAQVAASAIAISLTKSCKSEVCNLTKEEEQPESGDPYDLDGAYQPPQKICVYTCPKTGIVRQYYPSGTKCEKTITQP